jgi:hypothetical protein
VVSGDRGAGEEMDVLGMGGNASIRRSSEDDMNDRQQQAGNGKEGCWGVSMTILGRLFDDGSLKSSHPVGRCRHQILQSADNPTPTSTISAYPQDNLFV